MKSTKLYASILMAALGLISSMPASLNAQSGPNFTDPEKRTKTVRGCEYEVLPGLAEITSIKITKDAELSVLEYDEHEVLFKFTPMEGGELLEFLKEEEIDFVLRSRNVRIPVGPAYIQRKNLKVGTKYAMNLLQTKNKEACLERYTFESKALDNDLFEAEAQIIPYTKASFADQQMSMEQKFQNRKAEQKTIVIEATTTEPVTESSIYEDLKNDPSIDWNSITTEELRILVEEKMREAADNNNFKTQTADDLKINRDSMEQAIRANMYKKANLSIEDEAPKIDPEVSTKNKAQALRDARKAKQEKERQEKLLVEQQAKADKERAAKIAALKADYEKEIEAKIKAEIEAKKAAKLKEEQAQKAIADQKAAAKARALEKLKAIEAETKDRLIKEQQRKNCRYGERISGTIEVVKVSEAKKASESHLKHVEYEVLLSFRPDNYATLSKKDKKQWEGLHVFTIDPKGANANPGPSYVRKYKVFKSSKYQGFVQVLEGGVCNDRLFFSPDLPIDVNQLKLK